MDFPDTARHVRVGTTRKRILFLQHVSGIAGSSWSLLQMISAIDRSRYEICVAVREKGPLVDALTQQDLSVLVRPGLHVAMDIGDNWTGAWHYRNLLGLLRMGRAMRSAADLCKAVKPDLVYINSAVLFHLAAGARKAVDGKVVLHVREHWNDNRRSLVNRLKNRIVARCVDRIVAITNTDAACFGFQEKTTVIHNWPDFADRSGEVNLQREFGIPPGRRVLLVLAGRNPLKGGLVAAEAMRHVTDPRAVLLILGGTSAMTAAHHVLLKRVMRRMGVLTPGMRLDRFAEDMPGRLVLSPVTKEIRSVIEQSYAIICPFTQPHFAKAAIEAGALGKPVILSDGGEARETVVDGETGLLVRPGDPIALAAAMNRLLDNPAQADALGQAARNFVSATFNRERSMAQWHNLMRELLDT